MTVAKLVYKFSAFNRTWRFFTVYIEDLPWASWTQHTNSHSVSWHPL